MSFAEFDLAMISSLPQDFSAEDVTTRLQALQDNIRFIAAVIQTAREGSALIGFNADLSGDLPVGTPVYFDSTTGTFKPSKLQLVNVSGRYLAGPTSECWGAVYKKCGPNKAHLLLDGIAAINMSATTGQANPTGKWYLSTDEGEYTSTPGRILVCPVFLGMGNGKILFRPWFADNFPRFFPQTIELTSTVAGVSVVSGPTTAIQSANNAVVGWLPASNSIFTGSKPAGALFGYNWKQDPNLSAIWPPVYPTEAELVIDAGGNLSQGGHVIPGDSARCIIDGNGIWWMSNCTGQLPWDFAPAGAAGQTVCPKSLPRKIWLKASFGPSDLANLTAVNSLKSRTPWIQVYSRDSTQVASTGHLDVMVDESQLVDAAANNQSALAIKVFEDGKFKAGPVVTSIKSNSASLQITGGSLLEGGARSGALTMQLTSSKDFDLLPLEIKLDNAKTEHYNDTIAIGLRNGTIGSFTVEFHVPVAVTANTQARFRFWFLAPTTMTLPAGLELELARMAAPGTSPGTLPTFTAIDLDYPDGDTLQVNTYIQAESEPIAVTGGDTLYIRLKRDGTTDGVAADLHVLKIFGVFV